MDCLSFKGFCIFVADALRVALSTISITLTRATNWLSCSIVTLDETNADVVSFGSMIRTQ